MIGNMIKNNEATQLTGAIFIDLPKAFDTTDHEMLLNKLDYYGIRGVANDLIRSYLSNRQIRTKLSSKIGTVISTSETVNIGCPQGSILGPLFYSIIANDIFTALNSCDCICYADNTTILYAHKDISTIERVMQKRLRNSDPMVYV